MTDVAFIVIGSVDFSKHILNHLIEQNAHVAGVIAKKTPGINADFTDLSIIANEHSISCIKTDDINASEVSDFIKKICPDYLLCVGWSQLIKQHILDLAKIENIGYHPTELPQNKGRHPVIWALALGLEKTGSSFFFIREHADAGPLLSQSVVRIHYEDDANTLLNKLKVSACAQLTAILAKINEGTLQAIEQNHSEGNTWRKRYADDGRIDFRMSSNAIYNLTRALTKPYIGAHIEIDGNQHKVWRVEEKNASRENEEPGKVLQIDGEKLWVKTSNGSVLITEHDIHPLPKVGDYL